MLAVGPAWLVRPGWSAKDRGWSAENPFGIPCSNVLENGRETYEGAYRVPRNIVGRIDLRRFGRTQRHRPRRVFRHRADAAFPRDRKRIARAEFLPGRRRLGS